MQIRCPECLQTLELPANPSSQEISCPSCGFSHHPQEAHADDVDPRFARTIDVQKSLPDSGYEEARQYSSTDEINSPEIHDIPEKIARYRVEKCLGQGAFGRVYLAYDEELKRRVAIKVPHRHINDSSSDSGSSQIELYQNEARNVASLDHPNIVPVYDVGETDDSRFFVVSKYIDGTSLEDRIKDDKISHHDSADIVESVAMALQHAHEKGLVHRDIKPANILIDQSGTTLVTDFGMAVHENDQYSKRGEVTGSPSYMAPEQTRGEVQLLDGRTDIWALGALFYQLLTGREPFSGEGYQQLFNEICHRQPKPPRQIDPSIPAELERITLKCLQKEMAQRYNSAGDLANELQRYATRHSRRNRFIYGVSAAIIVVVLAILVGSSFFNQANPPLQPARVTPATIEGKVNLHREDVTTKESQSYLSFQGQTFVVRDGDLVRIAANVSRPSYLYLIWIEGDGSVTPIFPWSEGAWDNRPDQEERQTELFVPNKSEGWEMQGEPGVETIVLLARKSPLPSDVDLNQILNEVPPQELPRDRAPNLKAGVFRMGIIDDTERTNHLKKHLGDRFELIRSISFANVGDGTLPKPDNDQPKPDKQK